MSEDECAALEKDMYKLVEKSLSEPDRDLVKDLIDSLRIWRGTTFISPQKWQQIQRMKETYL